MTSFPEGKRAHSFYLCHGVRQADAVLNLPKMKTHALERITGAVKNLYGCVCGVNKAAGHASYPDRYAFAEMLADLNRCVKPRLHILGRHCGHGRQRPFLGHAHAHERAAFFR